MLKVPPEICLFLLAGCAEFQAHNLEQSFQEACRFQLNSGATTQIHLMPQTQRSPWANRQDGGAKRKRRPSPRVEPRDQLVMSTTFRGAFTKKRNLGLGGPGDRSGGPLMRRAPPERAPSSRRRAARRKPAGRRSDPGLEKLRLLWRYRRAGCTACDYGGKNIAFSILKLKLLENWFSFNF